MSIEEKQLETLALATDVDGRTRRVLQHVEKLDWYRAHAECSDAVIQSLRLLQALAVVKAVKEGLVKEELKAPSTMDSRPKVWIIHSLQVDSSRPREIIEVPELDGHTKNAIHMAFNDLHAFALTITHRPTQKMFTFHNCVEFDEQLTEMRELQEKQETGKASHLWTGETSPAPTKGR